MAANLTGNYEFTPDNVFQEGCPENKRIIGDLVSQLMLPGSRIENAEAFAELRRRSMEGQSCLILAEHYSNFDYPALYKLIEDDNRLGPEIAASLLPIRGMKLSETTPFTAAFSRSYDTIIIYPSRSLDSISDPNELA